MALTINQKIALKKDEYNSLLITNKDLTKIFSILFAFLGGIVSAFVSLFTVYCVCGNNDLSTLEWILFALNIIAICSTALADIYGIFLDHMMNNKKNVNEFKEKCDNVSKEEMKSKEEKIKEDPSNKIKSKNSSSSQQKFGDLDKHVKNNTVDGEYESEDRKYINDAGELVIPKHSDQSSNSQWLEYYIHLNKFVNENYPLLDLVNKNDLPFVKYLWIKDYFVKNDNEFSNIKKSVMNERHKIEELQESLKECSAAINKISKQEDNTELLIAYNLLIAEVEKKIKFRRRFLKIVCCCNVAIIVLMVVTAIIFRVNA